MVSLQYIHSLIASHKLWVESKSNGARGLLTATYSYHQDRPLNARD